MWVWMGMLLSLLGGPGCDAKGIEEGAEALEHMEPDSMVPLASRALVLACRWPDALESSLDMIASVEPSRYAMADFKFAADSGLAMEASCKGLVAASQKLAQLPPDNRRQHLWTACKGSMGFATESQWHSAHETGLLLTPIIVYHALIETGTAKSRAGALARGLAGISTRPQDNPVREFQPLYR